MLSTYHVLSLSLNVDVATVLVSYGEIFLPTLVNHVGVIPKVNVLARDTDVAFDSAVTIDSQRWAQVVRHPAIGAANGELTADEIATSQDSEGTEDHGQIVCEAEAYLNCVG